jgi:EAL domain-containing protein (putative c-di-GMP-specific phosphodiesterase class I)
MAKELGRNRIHIFHHDDEHLAKRSGEMQWVARLNQALEEDRFCLYAQSIEPLDSRTDKHYELLIRMVDEKGEIIPPGAFLPAAERYNLISKLDHWVIKNAFGLLADNPAFLKQINFCSINLSGQSLTAPEILEFIISQMHESGIQGEKICFEITETAAISNLSRAVEFISTLKELGCQFALDDFGSGLSSFGYLKNLPVDYLKIDGMFVKDIVDDPIDHAMVKSINEIGHVMGMQTIAEFVENDEIKGMLREIGVNFAQGYGIDKPFPFNKLLARLNNVIDIKNPANGKYGA